MIFRPCLPARVCALASFLVLGAIALSPGVASAQQAQPHGDLDRPCAECHTVDSWTPLRQPLDFDHDDTGFPLLGSHAAAACTDCHASLVFSHVGAACADCHADAHRGELGFACETCHDAHTWENRRAMLDRHGATLFPLFGPHATLDCESCHGGQRPYEYATTPIECVGCHLGDWQATRQPNHASAGFGFFCEGCHGAMPPTWREAVLEHPTSFPLTGAHRATECSECHASGFAGTPTECYACHRDDYEATRDPNHVAAGFSKSCERCHGTSGWPTADFDHDTTAFPLTGQHRGVDCTSCHTNGYAGTPTDCYTCHRADYEGTRDPNHVSAGFPTDCRQCHDTSGWEGAQNVDHDQTAFPLTGAHRSVDCSACHTNGYAGTPTNCVACHRDDYDGTTDPDHAAAGFPTRCQDCHDTSSWSGASFDHDSTAFPLTGAHRSAPCDACHANGYAGTPTNCVACHRDDYDNTSDPNHVSAGFGTNCQNCHDTRSWFGANFDHDADFFPINSGRHRGVWSSCSDCHTSSSDYRVFSCLNCHAHSKSQMDHDHSEVRGYTYDSNACYRCHPDGRGDD